MNKLKNITLQSD